MADRLTLRFDQCIRFPLPALLATFADAVAQPFTQKWLTAPEAVSGLSPIDEFWFYFLIEHAVLYRT